MASTASSVCMNAYSNLSVAFGYSLSISLSGSGSSPEQQQMWPFLAGAQKQQSWSAQWGLRLIVAVFPALLYFSTFSLLQDEDWEDKVGEMCIHKFRKQRSSNGYLKMHTAPFVRMVLYRKQITEGGWLFRGACSLSIQPTKLTDKEKERHCKEYAMPLSHG